MSRSFLFVKLFWRDLRANKKRMTLTLIAVLWGTLSIVLLLAFANGLKSQLMNNSKGLGEGIIIVWGGQTTIPYEGLGKARRIRFYPEDLEELKKQIPEIEKVGADYFDWGTSISYGKNTVSARTNGLFPSFEVMRAHYPQPGGRFINEIDMQKRRRVVFLGDKVKENLFGEQDAVGKIISINNIPFTVVGVQTKKQQMGSYSGPDNNKVSIPATTFSAIWGQLRYSNIVVKPRDPKQAEFVKTRMYEVIGKRQKFDPKDKAALSIWDVIEMQNVMEKMMLGLEIFFGVMGFFSLSIAGLGVANIMYAAIKERTVEIGVKMALGAKPRQIMGQFILEALLICGIGGLLGIVFAQGICSGFARVDLQNEALSWLGKPTISVAIGMVTVAILAFVGLTAGFFPARRAASVNPVESLRYE
ncbi:MAG: ABC transporter permease [candidate division Zixibacteria bacterium]|nr:ABC transporter permease [candidate division Zixibacteria bacterium]